MVDYGKMIKYAPKDWLLRIELVVSVYDMKIFKPIDAIITVENAENKEQNSRTAIEPGVTLLLPLGE